MNEALVRVALAGFAVAVAMTPLVRRVNTALGIIDIPNERSSHTRPVTRAGGIAILAGIIAAFAISGEPVSRAVAWIAAGALLVAAIGLFDDVKSLSAKVRLGAQTLAAIAAIAGGAVITRILFPGESILPLAMLGIPVTIFWIAGVTNAYNFMDGINGIASLEAVVSGVTLSILLSRAGATAEAVLALALAAAALGFLPWNFPNARVFMGDVASGTFGFCFAALVAVYAARGGSVLVATLPLWPFLLDTASTLVRRIWRGEAYWNAHRSHFYQRLTSLGWSHTSVSLLYAFLALLCSVVAVAFDRLSAVAATSALAALIALHAGLAFAITRAERARTSD